ncbi:MAG: hypothetical protein ACE5KV_04330 [Thermoplasmata archaeon]
MAFVLNNISDYFGENLEMISLSLSTDYEIRRFKEGYGNDRKFGHIDGGVHEDHGRPGFPHFVIIHRKSIMRYEITGEVSFDEPREAIEQWV